MSFIKQQTGMTLLELTVVLLILVALAGVAIPYLGGTSSTALCNATDVTMQNVKKAIMERYYLDTLGQFPNNKNSTDFNLKYLFTQGSWQAFDPQSQTGWRGPYLQSGIILSGTDNLFKAANLSTTFTDPTRGFVNASSALINGDTVVLDGWGRPLIIQVDTTNPNNPIAKLVSAGAGSGVGLIDNSGTPLADIDTLITGNRTNDDRILYLNAPTPANDVNPPCNGN
jgi:type II secretory pathway pseudopilin PulG